MTRPKLLDLCCGAGGASVGYHRAGFDVTGVDHLPHADYPFPLIIGDAMSVLSAPTVLSAFDVITASPPCPAYSTITPNPSRHPKLIEPMRDALIGWGGVYVIENVAGAVRHMVNPVKVCGSSFGLRVRRHRMFESNVHCWSLPCQHAQQGRPIGVYGDHAQQDAEYRRPDGTRRGSKAATLAQAQDALGIDWMTSWEDLADSVPPAYTEFIGAQLIEHLEAVAA